MALIIKSLAEIFQIMCFKEAFDSPVVLCAAYVSLLKIGTCVPSAFADGKGLVGLSLPSIDVSFGAMISKLDAENYGLVLQELLGAGVDEVMAITALEVAIDSAGEGISYPDPC